MSDYNKNLRLWITILCIIVIVLDTLGATTSKTSTKVHKGCDKTIRTTRLIRSPRVTSANRNKPIHCVYRLVKYGVSELLYELNFKSFHVGSHHNGSLCSNGYLQIVDHPTRINAAGYFCGKLQYSRTFLAETDQLALVFHADTYTRQTYFRVQASVLPKRLAQERHKELVMANPGEAINGTYCDRLYVNCRGFCDVTSPNYPGFYPRNATCHYQVLFNETVGGDSSRIVLGGQYYDSFDVWGGPLTRCHSNYCSSKEVTTSCPYDHIAVYDVTSNGETSLIQTFCGRGHLPRIASSGSEILLKFVSAAAGSISNDGFYLSVGTEVYREHNTGVLVNGTCHWSFQSKDGHWGHFQNPRHWYPPGTRCSYRFLGSAFQKVFLHFTYFNSNRDEGCRSKLTLYDSGEPDGSAVRGVFCGKRQPNETFLSVSERFYVEFDSKLGSYDGSNFEYSVLYSFVDHRSSGNPVPDTLCDEVFSSTASASGSKQGHLDFFQNRLRLRHRHVVCTFRFEGRHTERIRLIFTHLQFDPTRICDDQQKRRTCSTTFLDTPDEMLDHLMVMDARKNVVDCLCGGTVHFPHEIVSTESFLEVRLHLYNIPTMAYRNMNTYSFKGTYEFLQVGCGEDYHAGKQGQLIFPSLSPKLLPGIVHCRWTIEVSHHMHILLKFAHLSLAGNCSTSSLRLYAPWSKELNRELCLERWSQLEVEPLGWREGLTTKKSANKVVLELNASSATRFRLLWTEVNMVNLVSSDADSEETQCDYRCRGSSFCLTKDLVCNGIINCPAANASWDPLDESFGECVSIAKVLQWVFATFSTSFVLVLLIATLFFWRRKLTCARSVQ